MADSPAALAPRSLPTAPPALADVVELPAGRYRLGPPGAEREVVIAAVLIGRYPVVNAQVAGFLADGRDGVSPALARRAGAEVLADHPATEVTLAGAEAFCAWAGARLGRRVRLPSGDEWEACARGGGARIWPWGDSFEEAACASVETGWGWTAPVGAHPLGASENGAEQLAGNVWEWVADRDADGWGVVRGGSYLDAAAGLRTWRALSADPARATGTTGFRIAIDVDSKEAE